MTSISDEFSIFRHWWRWGKDFKCATRLNIIEVTKCSFLTNGFVAEVAVLGGVNCQDKPGEIHKETP